MVYGPQQRVSKGRCKQCYLERERARERGEELYNQHLHAVAGQQSPNEPTINKKIFSFNQLTEKKKNEIDREVRGNGERLDMSMYRKCDRKKDINQNGHSLR